MDFGVVKGLFIYPVKGLRGISLTSSLVEPEGLRFDRRWMVVGAEGRFRSQRQMPHMATLIPSFDDGLIISDLRGHSVRVGNAASEPISVTVWSSEVKAYLANQKVNDWLSKRLGESVRLVAMGPKTDRPLPVEYSQPADRVGFADGFPILMASESSLSDLNARLTVPIPMDRFRPNIVISGADPWDEDGLTEYQIGNIRLDGAKLCARCQVPTIDQTTGEKTGPEPLVTLATFRTIDGKVMFGTNMIPRTLGEIRVGETVTAIPA